MFIDNKYKQLHLEKGLFLISNTLVENLLGEQNKTNSKLQHICTKYNIYSGYAGIALFLIELYKFDENPRYLKAIDVAKKRMLELCLKDKSYNFSFYKGKSGVIFTLSKIYKITNEVELLDYIKELVNDDLINFIESKYVDDSLFEGRTGLMIVLNHLYTEFKEKQFYDLLIKTIEGIVSNAKLTENGIIWDELDLFYQKQSGFAYGTEGICYALSEMSNLFGTEFSSFFKDNCIINTFLEDLESEKPFSKIEQDYLQFILSFYDKNELSRRFLGKNEEKDFSFVRGMTGAGFVSLNVSNKKIIYEIVDAITKNFENTNDFSIATGKAGYLLFFHEVFKVFEDNSLSSRVLSELEQAIQNVNYRQNLVTGGITDFGLFTGVLGMGYVLLHVLNHISDSPVLFKTSELKYGLEADERVRIVDVKEYILAHNFSRLYYLIDRLFPNEINEYLNEENFDIDSFFRYIKQLSMESEYRKQIQDLIEYEKKLLKIKYAGNSSVVNFIETNSNYKRIEEILNLSKNEFLNLKIGLSDNINFITSKWNWTLIEENLELDEEVHINLISRKFDGTLIEFIPNRFELPVVKLVEKPGLISQKLNDFVMQVEDIDEDDAYKIGYEIIRDFIYKGFFTG